MLFTHECGLISTCTAIVQFTHDIITGLISYKDEAAYRVEVDHVAERSKDSDLAFNRAKTKEMRFLMSSAVRYTVAETPEMCGEGDAVRHLDGPPSA